MDSLIQRERLKHLLRPLLTLCTPDSLAHAKYTIESQWLKKAIVVELPGLDYFMIGSIHTHSLRKYDQYSITPIPYYRKATRNWLTHQSA